MNLAYKNTTLLACFLLDNSSNCNKTLKSKCVPIQTYINVLKSHKTRKPKERENRTGSGRGLGADSRRVWLGMYKGITQGENVDFTRFCLVGMVFARGENYSVECISEQCKIRT